MSASSFEVVLDAVQLNPRQQVDLGDAVFSSEVHQLVPQEIVDILVAATVYA